MNDAPRPAGAFVKAAWMPGGPAWRARMPDLFGSVLRRGSLSRGVSTLFVATCAAQATSLAVSPILTRLYRPDQFGVLAIYTGLVTVLTSVAALRYEAAIPIARDDAEAAHLAGLSGLIVAGMTGLLALLFGLLPGRVLAHAGLGGLGPYRFMVPVGFACLGAFSVLYSIATRNAAFGTIARTRLTQALSGPASQIALGAAGAGTIGLMLGTLIGQCAGMLALLRQALSAHPPRPTCAGMLAAARRYRAFPLVSSWGVLADMIGATLALYLLAGLFFPPAVVGFLYLIDRVVSRPIQLVTTSLAPVMFSAAGRDVHSHPERLLKRFTKVALAGAAVTGAWMLAVLAAVGWLLPRLFGGNWAGAVPFVGAICLWFFFAAVGRLIGPTLQVLERQWLNALPQVGGPVSGALAFVLCARSGIGAPGAVLAYAGCQAAAWAFTIGASFIALRAIQPQSPAGAP